MTYYTHIKKAPLKYFDENGEYKQVTVKPIKGVQVANSFNIPFVRGVVGLYNYMVSTMMYWATYEKNKQEKKYQKAQEFVYIPAHNISPAINRCESQSYNIIRTLERLFNIQVSRAHEKFGANTFTLSHQVNEFMHIFTEEKLQAYIQKYNIDPLDVYALRQVYNYRVVRPTDNNLSREERAEFDEYMKKARHKNFLHFCAQNNKSYDARIEEIENNIEFLTELQQRQLQRIKTYLSDGTEKLANYYHWALIKIQQYVSMKLKVKAKPNKDQQEKQSLAPSESKRKETAQHKAATRVAQRKPSPSDIAEILATWHNELRGQDNISLSEKINIRTYNAICKQVKSYGKETIISSIKKLTGLNAFENGSYSYNLKTFFTEQTIEIIINSKVQESIQPYWLADYIANIDEESIEDRISIEDASEFDSKEDVIHWFNKNKNS